MVAPLILLGLAGAGLTGAAAGAGIAGLVAGKKEEIVTSTSTYAPQYTITKSTQSTYAPTTLTTSTNTSTRTFAPQYLYAPQLAYYSPYATQESKKSLSVAGSSESATTPSASVTTQPQITPTVTPQVVTAVSPRGGGSEFPIGSLVLLGGAALVLYLILKK